MQTLITASELQHLLGKPDVFIVDCRFSLQDPEAGRQAYLQGHLPAAHFADMNQDLSSPHIPGITGRHPLPQRDAFIAKLASWGISPEVRVVAYDDLGGAGAARLWWLLQWVGHANVRVLDGGMQAWTKAGGELTTQLPEAPVAVSPAYAGLDALMKVVTAKEIDSDMQLLVDARELPRFRGEVEPVDPVAGHIPGALCSPFSANLQADSSFKSVAELQEKFKNVAPSFLPVICYCGSGVTACHNILAIAHAGIQLPALYAGSWSEWITDPSRPVATGDSVWPG